MYRNIVFTPNNYTEEEYISLLNHHLFKYVVIGKEVGERGTPHLQGYAELVTQMDLVTVKKDKHPRKHFQRRYGSRKEAIDYCKKDGNYHENGRAKRQGKRTDLNKVRELISSEISYRELLQSYELNYGQLRVADRYYTYLEPKRNFKIEVIWCHGATGTDTSYWAENTFPDAYVKEPDDKWWDEYDGQEVVIMDEFRGSDLKFNKLLRLFVK
jgi:hypothetical protein